MPERFSSRDNGCLPLLGLLFAIGGVALAVYTWRLPSGVHSDSDLIFRKTMSLIITGVGIVLIAMSRREERSGQSVRKLATLYPDKPWLWRDDWEQGYARPEAASQAVLWLEIGLLLLLLSVPIGLKLRIELVEKGNYAALLALVFPIIGLLMLARSAVSGLRHRKFANLRLALSGVPAVLGGRLTGRIEGDFRLPQGTELTLVLSCVRSYVSGQGRDRPRWQRVLWQDKRSVATVMGRAGLTSIPVEFEIPYDLPQTDSRDPDDEFLWRLTADRNLPGLDFGCEFRTPVFKTEASDPGRTVASLEAKSRARQGGTQPADSEILSGPSAGGGVRFYLAAARHKGIAAAMTVFGLLTLGSGLFFGYGLSFLSWMVGAIPLVIFGGFGLLLLAIAFGLWFRATTVEVVNRELRVRSRYLLFAFSRTFTKKEIQSFELHSGMQRGDEVWYDLRVRLANGRRRTICGGMEKNEAEWFLGEIKKDMGI